MFTDTHAHLDYPDFEADLEDVLSRAAAAGIHRVVTIATGSESSRRAVRLAEQFPSVYAVVGVHPTNVAEEPDNWPDVIRPLASHPKVVAIGETGLDYHHLPSEKLGGAPGVSALLAEMPQDSEAAIVDGAYKAAQAEAFAIQLDMAVECGKNVVIHQRDAWDDTLRILSEYTGRLRGVFHCFGNTPDQAREVLALGHLVSFTGIVTFKNAPLVQEVASAIPLDTFLVETDCPYLAPVPHRGGRCEPAHTRLVAEKIATLRGIGLEELSRATEQTADRFFRFPVPA